MGATTPKVRSIDTLKNAIMQPALTSYYEVYIKPPEGAQKFIKFSVEKDMVDLLMISCSDASLPGSTLSTHELNNDFTGVTQRHAYRRLYDDRIDFSFYVNRTYDQIRYFESWMRYIVNEQTSFVNTNQDFRVTYPKYYKSSSIYITKFEKDLGKVTKVNKSSFENKSINDTRRMYYKFINAFPINISSMPVSYESSQLLKVTVSFSYDRYIASDITGEEPEKIIQKYVDRNGESTDQPYQENTSNSTATGIAGIPNVSDGSSYWNSNISLNPLTQSQLNSTYSTNFQGLNFGNFSTGTFTNTDLNQSVSALF